MKNEGIIKFECEWNEDIPFGVEDIRDLNLIREKLFKLGLIGVYDDGVGFGNISRRFDLNQFIITGTQTGAKNKLDINDYTLVTKFDIPSNFISCVGPIKASSESLTHAAVYSTLSGVNSVIHVHSKELWSKLINNVPTTDASIEYGTPELAEEIIRLLENSELIHERILVMAGHQDGIVSFGRSHYEAYDVLMSHLK